MITSKHASVIFLAGLLGVVTTQMGCGSDNSGPSGTVTAGSSGTASAGAAGSGISGGGSAGTAAAGAPAAGAPAGGAPATGGGGAGGTAGASAGAGGSTAGAGGSTAGAGGGTAGAGGSSSTFAAVKTLFGSSCGVGDCHNKASGNLDYQGTMDLHGMLTTAIPTGIAHCVGTTLVKANDATSFLVTAVKAGGNCPVGGGNIGRMPDNCGKAGKPACLTDAQVKTITDWIAAGAPN